MMSSLPIESDQLSPEMRRKIARLRKRLAKIEAENPDGVQPLPVRNRVTGELHEFGPRRCLDGAWVLELLAHSGVTPEQAQIARYVLEPLIEHGAKIDASTVELLSLVYQVSTREEREAVERGATLHNDGTLEWPSLSCTWSSDGHLVRPVRSRPAIQAVSTTLAPSGPRARRRILAVKRAT